MKPAAAPNGEASRSPPPPFVTYTEHEYHQGFRMKNTSSHHNRAFALRQPGKATD